MLIVGNHYLLPVTEYPHLLAYLCRRAVLENAPFELTRETIKHYGFSREDVKLLRLSLIHI